MNYDDDCVMIVYEIICLSTTLEEMAVSISFP